MDRRCFLKTLGYTGLAVAGSSSKTKAGESNVEFNAILVDTTMCAGCRSCEMACAEYHNFPEPDQDDSIFNTERKTSIQQFTLVNRYEGEDYENYIKKQCMHCNQPACASACLTKAMYKTKEGPVIWREDKCMGCRFCMISCPFDFPKFEYNSSNPKILKCNMCFEKISKGELPTCVDACPAEAIIYGKRRDMLEEARRRIYQNPDDYVHQVYGDDEAGGTGILYISNIPFEKLGLRKDISKTAYPLRTTDFLYSVPVVLTLLPPFLLALSQATKKEKEDLTEVNYENR